MSTNPNELAPPPPRASRRRLGPILLGLFAVVALPVIAIVLGLLAMATVHVRTQTTEPESYTTEQLWRLFDQHSQNGTLDQLMQKRFTVKGLVCYYTRPIPGSPAGRMAISRTGDAEAPDKVVLWLDSGDPIDKGMDVAVRGEFAYEDSYIVLRHAEIVEVKRPLQ